MTSIEETYDVSRDYGIRENAFPNGEKLAIFKVANTSMYKVAYAANARPVDMTKESVKGHEGLTGMYTNPSKAQEAITNYLNLCWERVKKTPVPAQELPKAEQIKRSDKEHDIKTK